MSRGRIANVLGGEQALQPWSLLRTASVSIGAAFVITSSAFLTFGNDRIMAWAGLATMKQRLQMESRDAVERAPACTLYLGGAPIQWKVLDRGSDGRCDEGGRSPLGRDVVRLKYGLRGPRSELTVFAEQRADGLGARGPFVAVQLAEVDPATGERAVLELGGARVD
jgi:hypothetical protein|tara:strand:+ start:155 stop:655 length:501 start_codon:yes stop_codon:yes gene_type:complete